MSGLGWVWVIYVDIYSICTNIPYVDAMLLFTLHIRNLYKRDISRIDLMRYRHSESKSECRGTFGNTI